MIWDSHQELQLGVDYLFCKYPPEPAKKLKTHLESEIWQKYLNGHKTNVQGSRLPLNGDILPLKFEAINKIFIYLHMCAFFNTSEI